MLYDHHISYLGHRVDMAVGRQMEVCRRRYRSVGRKGEEGSKAALGSWRRWVELLPCIAAGYSVGLVAVVLRNHQNSQKDKWSYLLDLQKLLGYILARNFDMLLDHTAVISSCFKLDMTITSAQVMSLEPNY